MDEPATATPGKASKVLAVLGPMVLERLDQLVEQHVLLVRATIAEYRSDKWVGEDDLRTAGRRMIEQAVRLLSETNEDPDPFAGSRALGSQRAEEGLPLEALLSAFRLGGRVVWEGFVVASRDARVSVDQAAMVDSVGRVWEIVDGFSLELSAAYRKHEARLRRQDTRARQAILDALVEGKGADAAFEREAGAILGLAPDAPAVCIVARFDGTGQTTATAPEEIVRALGLTSVWHVRAGTEFGIIAASEADIPRIVESLGTRVPAAMGLSPIFRPLREAALAFRLATLAVRTVPKGSLDIVTLDQRLPEALVAASPDLIPRLAAQTSDAFASLTKDERETYIATVRALLESQGSLKKAAEQLFCHRNTVLYRLERIRALTGTGLDSPRAVLLWTLGLIAEEQTNPRE